MSYTVWIKVENDDPPEFEGEAWWSVITKPTREEAVAEAEEIAITLNKMGMDVERLDDWD